MLGCAQMLVLSIILRQESATAVLRPSLELLIVLNVIILSLLLVNLRTALSQIYAPGRLWAIGVLTLGGGMLAPLCLLLVGGSPLLPFAAVLLLLLGSLAIRFVIIKVPHELSDNVRG